MTLEDSMENQSEIQEAALPTSDEAEGQMLQTQDADVQARDEPEANSQERNWRQVREVMRQQQMRIQELEKLANQKPEFEDDEIDRLPDDEILTKVQVVKLAAKQAKRLAQEEMQRVEVERQEERIAAMYPDYADVVEKYIPDLVKANPNLRATILSSPNKYLAAYEIAKNSYLYHQDQQAKKLQQTQAQRIQKNAAKPQSVNSVGKSSALSDAAAIHQMTDAQVWELAQRYAQR